MGPFTKDSSKRNAGLHDIFQNDILSFGVLKPYKKHKIMFFSSTYPILLSKPNWNVIS
jgi:hypothetical protein